jgi:hypothetical protein
MLVCRLSFFCWDVADRVLVVYLQSQQQQHQYLFIQLSDVDVSCFFNTRTSGGSPGLSTKVYPNRVYSAIAASLLSRTLIYSSDVLKSCKQILSQLSTLVHVALLAHVCLSDELKVQFQNVCDLLAFCRCRSFSWLGKP